MVTRRYTRRKYSPAISLGFAWLLLWEMVKPHLRRITAWRIAHTTLAVIGVVPPHCSCDQLCREHVLARLAAYPPARVGRRPAQRPSGRWPRR
jgi:hypothetical protein